MFIGEEGYAAEREKIARRRKVAEAMLAQSQQPMGDTQMVSGIAVRRSPLEGIAKIAQAYGAKVAMEKADTEATDLREKQRKDIADAMTDYQRAVTPRAGTEEVAASTDTDELGIKMPPAVAAQPAYTPTVEDRRAAALGLMGRVGDPRDAAKLMVADAFKAPPGPIKVGKDDRLLDPVTLKPVLEPTKAPKYHVVNGNLVAEPAEPGAAVKPAFTAPEKEPEAIRAAKAALTAAGVQEGSPQWQTAMQQLAAKMTTHAPAASTNVSVNTEKNFLNNVGDVLGKDIATTVAGAKAASGTISTVNQIREALDSGKVIAGPGTTARMFLGQLGQVMGVSGKDATEQLTQTRKAIQSMAQLELDAAQQMKGQGQITEAERGIIRRAASGDVDGMTVAELRTLTDTLDKTARSKIRTNAANVARLKTNPNAASMIEFMNVDEPPVYVPRPAPGLGGGGAAPKFTVLGVERP